MTSSSFDNVQNVEYVEGRACPTCGTTEHQALIGTWSGGHYAKVICSKCDRFIKWQGKPEAKKAKRPAVQKKLVSLHSKGFCEICLRLEHQIPAPQTLEAHHIIPVENGGGNEAENIQVCCTACHRLIHWQRTYIGHTVPQELGGAA